MNSVALPQALKLIGLYHSSARATFAPRMEAGPRRFFEVRAVPLAFFANVRGRMTESPREVQGLPFLTPVESTVIYTRQD